MNIHVIIFCAFLIELLLVVPSSGISTDYEGLPSDSEVPKTCEDLKTDTNKPRGLYLPSDHLELVCSCMGGASPQACPEWKVLSGLTDNATFEFRTVQPAFNVCHSYITFNDSYTTKSTDVTLKCQAPEQTREVTVGIYKPDYYQDCGETSDCRAANLVCRPDQYPSPKMCICPKEDPIFNIKDKNCYPVVGYGMPCNFSQQCFDPFFGRCEKQGNDTEGNCTCESGFPYNETLGFCTWIIPSQDPSTIAPEVIKSCDKFTHGSDVKRPYYLPSENPEMTCACFSDPTDEISTRAEPKWTLQGGLSKQAQVEKWGEGNVDSWTSYIRLYDNWRDAIGNKSNTFVDLRCEAPNNTVEVVVEIKMAENMEICKEDLDCQNPNQVCRPFYYPLTLKCACPEDTPAYVDKVCYPAVSIGMSCMYDEQCEAHDNFSQCQKAEHGLEGNCTCSSQMALLDSFCYPDDPIPSDGPKTDPDKPKNYKLIGALSGVGLILVVTLLVGLYFYKSRASRQSRRDSLKPLTEPGTSAQKYHGSP